MPIYLYIYLIYNNKYDKFSKSVWPICFTIFSLDVQFTKNGLDNVESMKISV